MGKILQAGELVEWRRAQKGRVVATNGCFDVLHVGHLRYLTLAKSLGDVLIVGVNGDESVKALKGEGRPINPEGERAELLAGLSVVDYVVIFNEVRATNFLALVKPNIYVKGGDYKPEHLDKEETNTVIQNGGKIKILPLVEGKSTTKLIKMLTQLDKLNKFEVKNNL